MSIPFWMSGYCTHIVMVYIRGITWSGPPSSGWYMSNNKVWQYRLRGGTNMKAGVIWGYCTCWRMTRCRQQAHLMILYIQAHDKRSHYLVIACIQLLYLECLCVQWCSGQLAAFRWNIPSSTATLAVGYPQSFSALKMLQRTPGLRPFECYYMWLTQSWSSLITSNEAMQTITVKVILFWLQNHLKITSKSTSLSHSIWAYF